MADIETTTAQAPDGTQYTIPVANIAKAQALGWDVDNPNETAGKQVETGALGFAHGLVPGAPAAIEALGGPTEQEQHTLGETNPLAYGAGKLAGTGLQAYGVAAATGGLGAAAEAGELGTAAAELTPEIASRLATERAASSLLSNGYAQQTIAGAVQGAGDYINESELGDHQFNGEALAMHTGIGALLGFGGEAGAQFLANKVAPPVIEKAGQLLDSVGGKLGAVWQRMTEAANGLEPGALRPAVKAILNDAAKPITREAANTIAETSDQVVEAANKVGNQLETEFRPGEVEKNLADIPPAQVRPAAQSVTDNIDQTLGQLQPLAEKHGYTRIVEAIDDANHDLKAALNDGDATSQDLHSALLKTRRSIGAAASDLPVVTAETAPDVKALIGQLKGLYGSTSNVLKDETVFGAEQAGRQASLDESWRNLINNGNQVAKDFGFKEIDPNSGKLDWGFKASKFFNALKERADPIVNQERLTHYNDWLESVKSFVADAKESAANAGAEVPGGDDVEALLDSVSKQRQQAMAYQPVAELQKRLREQPAWGLGAGGAAPLAGVLAHAAGVPLGGAAPIGALVASVRSPVKALQMYAKVAGAAQAAKDAIGSGVRAIFGPAANRTAATAIVRASLRGLSVGGHQFDKQSQTIASLASDLGAATGRIQQNTGRLSDTAPQTAMATGTTAVTALQVLNAAMPKNPSPSPIPSENKNWKPSESQMFDWNDVREAVLKPQSFVDRVAAGTANPKAWAALQQVYPQWCGELKSQVGQYFMNHPKLQVTNQQRLAASMILGVPASPMVSPNQVSFQQQLYATASPAPGQPQGHRQSGKSTQHGLDKLTLGDRLALGPHDRR
jgi:hypothetical protein